MSQDDGGTLRPAAANPVAKIAVEPCPLAVTSTAVLTLPFA